MAGLQQRRAAQNEAFFRDVNERAAQDRANDPSYMPNGREPEQRFVCECSDAECMETLLVAIDEYRDVRTNADRFIVLDGHQDDDIEHVVDRRRGYLVVEKFQPTTSHSSA